MNYEIEANKIVISKKDNNCDDFCPQHILECGQVFDYHRTDNGYIVYSGTHFCEIVENADRYILTCDDTSYFENYFDLATDYGEIKYKLKNIDMELKETDSNTDFSNLQSALDFGHGIRILRQDIFETIISFIISANNNIKRIQKIVNRLKEKYGQRIEVPNTNLQFFAFPSIEMLQNVTVADFRELGLGFRDKYVFDAVRKLSGVDLQDLRRIGTVQLKDFLLTISGIGDKVADCILLFGFTRADVFPVDTWGAKIYNDLFGRSKDETFGNEDSDKLCTIIDTKQTSQKYAVSDRKQMSREFVRTFGEMSGYGQQYLFYYYRSKLFANSNSVMLQ